MIFIPPALPLLTHQNLSKGVGVGGSTLFAILPFFAILPLFALYASYFQGLLSSRNHGWKN